MAIATFPLTQPKVYAAYVCKDNWQNCFCWVICTNTTSPNRLLGFQLSCHCHMSEWFSTLWQTHLYWCTLMHTLKQNSKLKWCTVHLSLLFSNKSKHVLKSFLTRFRMSTSFIRHTKMTLPTLTLPYVQPFSHTVNSELEFLLTSRWSTHERLLSAWTLWICAAFIVRDMLADTSWFVTSLSSVGVWILAAGLILCWMLKGKFRLV